MILGSFRSTLGSLAAQLGSWFGGSGESPSVLDLCDTSTERLNSTRGAFPLTTTRTAESLTSARGTQAWCP